VLSVGAATEALHPQHSDVPLQADRNDFVCETAVVPVADVDRHLSRVPLVRLAEHLEVNPRIFMPREAEIANFPRLLRFDRRLDPALLEDPIRIVVIDHFMKLPQVKMIRLQATEALVETLF